MKEVQQTLLNDDCFIPYLKNEDDRDFARSARAFASSEQPGFEAQNLLTGVHRGFKGASNLWKSAPLRPGGEWVRLDFGRTVPVRKLVLRFDSGLSDEIFVSINKAQLLDQAIGVPESLVRDYRIVLMKDGVPVKAMGFSGNYMRYVVHELEEAVLCDALKLECLSTNGAACAAVYEIRAY